jgi:hypothetical protein
MTGVMTVMTISYEDTWRMNTGYMRNERMRGMGDVTNTKRGDGQYVGTRKESEREGELGLFFCRWK